MKEYASISSSIGTDDYHERKTAQICIGDEVILEITQEQGIENAEVDVWTQKNGLLEPLCTIKYTYLIQALTSNLERLKTLSGSKQFG
jgi:hypothetical protein